jgi:glutamate dehydrogenase (NADP+)
MEELYATLSETASEFNCPGNLLGGANIAGLLKVANAMSTQGAV